MGEVRDPYLNTMRSLSRLQDELRTHGSLFVAFDFDNTVFDYHGKGWTFPRVEHLLIECKKLGFKLILFTAKETQEQLHECSEYCKQRGYEPDYINTSPVMQTPGKPYYNILLDDRAGLLDAVVVLEQIVRNLKQPTFNER